MIETLAGTGERGFEGDGKPAVRGKLSQPCGLASDRSGNLYVADLDNNRIRRIDAAGVITTIAGTGQRKHAGDGGPAIEASFEGPSALALDRFGYLYVAEYHHNRIRRIDPSGFITTVVGAENDGRGGDAGPAAASLLNGPAGLAVDREDNLFVSDLGNHRVLKITPDGSIATVAGTGMSGYVGDGAAAEESFLCNPRGLAIDEEGNLFVSDSGNHRVRRIDRGGVITTVAGTGMSQYSGDGGPAVLARLFAPDGLATDQDGNLYVGDAGNHRVRRIDRAGIITTVVGTGDVGNRGDGGPASEAHVWQPEALAVDRDGFLLVADSGNHNVRIIRLEDRISVKLGESGERIEFDFAAYGALWRHRTAYRDGSEVTAEDGSTFVLRRGAGGSYLATRRYKEQSVALPGGEIVRLVPCEDGTWRIGSRTVASGHRLVSGGNEFVLDLFRGRWTLVEHTLVDLIVTPDPLDGIPATQADLDHPSDVAVDSLGNVYVAEIGGARIRRIGTDGLIATVVDRPRAEMDGRVDPALAHSVFSPERLAADSLGNLYYSEWACSRIRKADRGGSLSTLAGMGPAHRGHSGEGVHASEALLSAVGGIALDGRGQVYFSDKHNHCVRRIDAQGVIKTIAGVGSPGLRGDGGPGREALLDSPEGVAVDGSGSVYVVDRRNARVRRISRDGSIQTIAGGGERRVATGDGCAAATARLERPGGLAADSSGYLYVAEYHHNRIRRIDPNGFITTIAGAENEGHGGDAGPAAEARLKRPVGVVADTHGRVYIGDSANHRVCRVGRDGHFETIAGTGKPGFKGDGGPACKALLRRPCGLAVDRAGNLYIADMGNHRIRKLDRSGLISTFAGTGDSGYSGDGGQALEAVFDKPYGVAVDASGNVYVSDIGNHRIRKIDPSRRVSTIAGNGEPGYGGDDGPAAEAMLHYPALIATDEEGNLYCADSRNQRVRKVDSKGNVSTVAGLGRCAFGGDRGPAERAFLNGPQGVAVDRGGNVYVADWGNGRVRKIDSDGIITTFAGGGAVFSTGDGGPAEQAHFESPRGIAVDASGSVYVADTAANRIRKFRPGGRITTFAGTGESGYGGDRGPAVKALLRRPGGLAADENGNVYVSDSGNSRVRRINAAGFINTVAGTGRGPEIWRGGPPSTAAIQAIAADGIGRLCLLAQDRVWRLDESGTVSIVAGAARESSGETPFDRASRLAADEAGNLYVAEERRVLRIDPSGQITTFAGTGECSRGYEQEKDPRDLPTWVGVDAAGNVYYLDAQRARVRKIDSSGKIATAVDLLQFLSVTDSLRLEYGLGSTEFLAVDADGSVFLARARMGTILKFDADGSVSRIAVADNDGGSEEGGPASSAVPSPPPVIGTDQSGNLYLVDANGEQVRKIDRLGRISTLAGPDGDDSSNGGAPAIPPEIGEVTSLAADAVGNLYVLSSRGDCVLWIDPSGALHLWGGTGGFASFDRRDPSEADDDGSFLDPCSVATDGTGTVYVADTGNHRVYAINSEGVIKTIAGTGEPEFSGDGGPATQAALSDPSGVAVDALGNIYIGDTGNRSVRKVDTSGVISSVYREPPPTWSGYEGDGGPAVKSRFVGPLDVAADGEGNVYIADAGDHRVRKVDADGTITMFAGTGQRGHEGFWSPARDARLDTPFRITADSMGNVFVADKGIFQVRKINSDGDTEPVAGTGTKGRSGDDGLGSGADVDVRDIAADSEGNLFLVDGTRVRQVDTSGVISTIAGLGRMLADGGGGPPIDVHLAPHLVATSRKGDVLFVDNASGRVRALRRNPLQTGLRTWVGRSSA